MLLRASHMIGTHPAAIAYRLEQFSRYRHRVQPTPIARPAS